MFTTKEKRLEVDKFPSTPLHSCSVPWGFCGGQRADRVGMWRGRSHKVSCSPGCLFQNEALVSWPQMRDFYSMCVCACACVWPVYIPPMAHGNLSLRPLHPPGKKCLFLNFSHEYSHPQRTMKPPWCTSSYQNSGVPLMIALSFCF